MIAQISSRLMRHPTLIKLLQRNITRSAALNMDPVQQVFLNQIKKYRSLSEKQGGGAVDAGAEYEQTKTEAIARIAKLYNVENPTKFPDFEFQEPDLNQDETEFTKE